MSSYTKWSLRLFGKIVESQADFFADVRKDLKKAGMRLTVEEYISTALLTSILLFLIEFPLFSFIFSILALGTGFSVFLSLTISFSISIIFFLFFLSYPKFIIKDKEKSIEKTLPFAGIYLSTISNSGLPAHKVFEIFSRFDEFGEVTREIKRIVNDMKAFGLNVYDSIEKQIKRTPSKDMRDLLWSISSTIRSGGDLGIFLSAKSETFLNNYRRKLREFSHSLTVFLEIYLTLLVLGAIFFTILTSIMSGLGGTNISIVPLQFFMIFFFIPLVSIAFIVLINSASPGGG
jgi:flagellar protein FlaJ